MHACPVSKGGMTTLQHYITEKIVVVFCHIVAIQTTPSVSLKWTWFLVVWQSRTNLWLRLFERSSWFCVVVFGWVDRSLLLLRDQTLGNYPSYTVYIITAAAPQDFHFAFKWVWCSTKVLFQKRIAMWSLNFTILYYFSQWCSNNMRTLPSLNELKPTDTQLI